MSREGKEGALVGAEGQGCPEGVGGRGLPRRGEVSFRSLETTLVAGLLRSHGDLRGFVSRQGQMCASDTALCCQAVRACPRRGPSLPGTVVGLGPLRLS